MSRTARIGIGVSAFIIFSSLIIFSIHQLFHAELNIFPFRAQQPVDAYLAPKQNIWSDLSVSEFEQILEFLYTVPNDLNLTREANATAWDNHIAIVEVLHPNKTDAVRYLDGDAPPPPRYARIIINEGATDHAGLLEYSVGPLPPTQQTSIEPLFWPYNSGRNRVGNPLPNYEDIVRWFASLGNEVSDIVDDLLGEVFLSNLWMRMGLDADRIVDHSRAQVFGRDATCHGSFATGYLE